MFVSIYVTAIIDDELHVEQINIFINSFEKKIKFFIIVITHSFIHSIIVEGNKGERFFSVSCENF